MAKQHEREKAIRFRKLGFSYSEILRKIPVAKSTLSLWLRSVGLAKSQKQRLTDKKLLASLKGAAKKKLQRLNITKDIQTRSRNEIGQISKRELLLIGVALYWAEGSKQKEHSVSQSVRFSNSDPKMIRLFLKWLFMVCKIPKTDIHFRISLHETAGNKLEEVQKHWAKITRFSLDNFKKIDWKKHNIRTIRKNSGENYFGLLNIQVRRSTNLNRKIDGWIIGINKQCGVV